jgi:TonB family protein
MMIAGIFLVGGSLALGAQSAAPQSPSACSQAMAATLTDGAAAEICAGEEAARLGTLASKDSPDKTRQWNDAAGHYRKAVALASKDTTKVMALNLLVNSYDAQHLNDPKEMETALRELIALTPDDLQPVYRLATLQEDEGLIDAAEGTLLDARHRQPDEVEPNRMLAQFYVRRVTALHKQELQQESQTSRNPGERDENGVYRVGGAVTAPSRLGVPKYPPDAQAAGLKGAVVVEVVVDATGTVTEPKIIQSIPLLDEAAIRAVRDWHFEPTLVNGQPVPVRMNLTVNFTLPSATPARRLSDFQFGPERTCCQQPA